MTTEQKVVWVIDMITGAAVAVSAGVAGYVIYRVAAAWLATR